MQERQKLSAINLTVDFWCFSQPVKVKQGNCRLTGHSGTGAEHYSDFLVNILTLPNT